MRKIFSDFKPKHVKARKSISRSGIIGIAMALVLIGFGIIEVTEYVVSMFQPVLIREVNWTKSQVSSEVTFSILNNRNYDINANISIAAYSHPMDTSWVDPISVSDLAGEKIITISLKPKEKKSLA